MAAEREGGQKERRRERESEGRRIARRVMGEGWGAMNTPCDTRCLSLHREGSSPSLEHSSLRMRYMMCVCSDVCMWSCVYVCIWSCVYAVMCVCDHVCIQ